MKNKPDTHSFDLPVFLSLNELAWIAVFAMGLCSAYFFFSFQKEKSRSNNYGDDHHQLIGALDQLRDATNHIDILNQQITDLTNLLVNLSNRLSSSEAEVRTLQDDLARATRTPNDFSNELASVRDTLSQLTNRLNSLINSNDLLSIENAALKARLARANESQTNLTIALQQAEARMTNRPSEEGIRQEILNLQGRMSNVVILLDASASMGEHHRWDDACKVVNTWLHYLPVSRCALIAFADAPTPFPANHQLLSVQGPSGEGNRGYLTNKLAEVKPSGNTRMLSALTLAYSYTNIDTLIIFTDGEPFEPLPLKQHNKLSPKDASEGSLNSAERRDIARELRVQVLAEVRNHPGIPVNIVGVADYFDREKSDFLINLAKDTKGAFLGR